MRLMSLFPCITAAAFMASASLHASEPDRNRVAHAPPAASTAFVDARTGVLREGTPTERAELARRSGRQNLAWPATEAQALQTEVKHYNGMVSMLVPTDRMVFTKVEIDATGNPVITHFDPDHDHGDAGTEERPHE